MNLQGFALPDRASPIRGHH